MESLTTATAVVGYALSSSLLAIVNKYAVTVFPFPAVLTAAQYITCVLATLIGGRLGFIEHDPVTVEKAFKFLPAALTFFVAVWTNTQLLKHANVETFIVFRSCTPLLVAVADSLFLKRPWPSRRTFLSLWLILGGAIAYVRADSQFTVTAYAWAWSYLICITFEMVYIKKVVMSAGLNTWGLVLYNNLEALIFVPPSLVLMNEPDQLADFGLMNAISLRILTPVVLSCIFGLTISYFGFLCRKVVSATAYTVIGVTNKFITIFINLIIWDKHASPEGLLALVICIVGGIFYQQSLLPGKPKDAEREKLLEESDLEHCGAKGQPDSKLSIEKPASTVLIPSILPEE